MVETAHCLGFLGDISFEVGVFHAFLERNALDGVKGVGVGKFGGQDDMAEVSFTEFSNDLEMTRL